MSPMSLIVIVIAAAALAALAYAHRVSHKRDARHGTDAGRGRGLIDESAAAIEDVAAQFLSIGTDRGDRRR